MQKEQEREDFESLLNNYMGASVEGTVIKGKVVDIQNDIALIDVGLKSEGRIDLSEFSALDNTTEVKIGDEVEVYVERMEGQTGEVMLSRERARQKEAWVELEKKCNDNEQVEGIIVARVRGGFTVQLDSVQAFLPGSQIDMRPISDVTPIMNCVQPFQILSMDEERGNIVVSRRAVLEESRASQRNELMSQLYEGQVLEGVVKNITNYGAFVDLGGLDGLLHVTDILWRRISHPSEVLKIGETITVKIIYFDPKKQRVSLGIKQLEEDPWQKAVTKYRPQTRHVGRITNVTEYGAFIELEEGVEGLVHVSEMSWGKKNFRPAKMFSTSQEVEVMVLDVDTDKRRVSLGIKQCTENPWTQFALTHPVNSIHKGPIKNITDFGVFVGLQESIDGMVRLADLAWNSNGEEEVKTYKKGDEIEVKVLALDPEKEHVTLGVKQLSETSQSGDVGRFKSGSVVTCEVSKISDSGIEVDVDGVVGFIARANLSKERSEQRPDRYGVGEKLDAKIIKADKAKGSLTLSIKAYEIEQEKKVMELYGSTDSGASLGDILGAALKKKQAEQPSEEETGDEDVGNKKTSTKKASAKKSNAKKTTAKKAVAADIDSDKT